MIQSGTSQFWRASLALAIGSFLVFANLYMTQPLLPVFVAIYGVSETVSSLSISLVILTLSLSLLIFAALSDAYGRKPVMVCSMVGVTLATWLLIWVPSFPLLLVVRALQGIFLAGLPAVAIAYIADEFDPSVLSSAVGIYISGNTVGGMVGRAVSGFAADWGGYKTSFAVMGCTSLLCLVLFLVLLPEPKRFQRRPFHWRKSLKEMQRHLVNPTLLPAFFAGGLHFFLFVGLYNDVTFLLSSPPYYLTPTWLGFLFLTYLAGTVSSTIAGWTQRWWRLSTGVSMGIAFIAVGLIITLERSIGAIVCGLLAVSFGFFFAHSLTSSYVSKQAPFAKAGASSIYLVAYYLGGSLGSTLLGLVYFIWQWNGVVCVSLLVLLLTFACSQVMRRHEGRHHTPGTNRVQ
ncbi:MFS transporter [Brevibacillus humidisoli]|uniref:MFS transporter n=1 Tax=Brevibacillus humidisoli TaxID=2895522 RepID=UPI001E34F74F|nr:MFS transporter [Brevibacillus humidisoli]UFJ41176.1 MFS transporter [Brevibacillus humidisoli]